jgi:hypothetical protein
MDERLMAVIKAHADMQSFLVVRRKSREARRLREPVQAVYSPGMSDPMAQERTQQEQDVMDARQAILEAIGAGYTQADLLLEYAEVSATVWPREVQIALAELVGEGILIYSDPPESTQLAIGPQFPSKETPSL